MDEREIRLLDRIKADDRVKFIADLSGGRVVIEIQVAEIKTHDTLKLIRGGDNRKIDHLARSISKTGKDSLYCISLFVPDVPDDQPLAYFCGDGHQRHRCL